MAEATPWLIVGLGNPGPKYAGNRHNVGFMAVERWADAHDPHGLEPWREKFHGRVRQVRGAHGRAWVLEPLTFMNRSGKSVQAAQAFHRIAPERTLVVHDELDFEFGRIGLKAGGGHGGHNGLRDIAACTGSRDFPRLRVGIGRPSHPGMDVAAWVLSDFSVEDRSELDPILDAATAAVTALLEHGLTAAMNRVNAAKPAPLTKT